MYCYACMCCTLIMHSDCCCRCCRKEVDHFEMRCREAQEREREREMLHTRHIIAFVQITVLLTKRRAKKKSEQEERSENLINNRTGDALRSESVRL
jgi:hypothetical protein